MTKPLHLLSIGHSYVVSANRALAHAMQAAGNGRWRVTVAAPLYFQGQNDIRAVSLNCQLSEPCETIPLSAYLTGRVHLFAYGRRLRSVLHRRWDLVHCWEEPYVVAGAQAAWCCPDNTPFVFRSAQSLPKRYPPPFRQMERFVIDRAAGWICSGQTVAENLARRPGYSLRPSARIPLGVDVDRFQPDAAASATIRRQLGWAVDGPPVVGYIGRFVSAKGIEMLMRSLDAVKSPWRALFIGAGPLEPLMRAWADRHEDRVRICTQVLHDEVPGYANAMDMLCAPSQTMPFWREQFGRMLIEAFACGKPAIGSDSGEIPFVIGNTGKVVGEKDEAGWTQAIGELIDDNSLRQRLGAECRERAVREFQWSVIGRRHIDFFDSILDGAKPVA